MIGTAKRVWVSIVLAFSLACGLLAGGCGAEPTRPLILITVDTLRADHLRIYDADAPLPTPSFDRIGHEGALIESTFAPFGRTTQSVGTIVTGLHPLNHGADGLGMQLPLDNKTLAESLREAGYRTAAFTSNLQLRPQAGFEQGFELYSNPRPRWIGNSAFDLTQEALAWLRGLDGEQPFFLWVHYLDPHWPYKPDEPFATQADPEWSGPFDLMERVAKATLPKSEVLFRADEHLTAREIEHTARLYAGEVAQTDAAVGQLLDGIEQAGLLEDAVVAFTVDHGESLGEHRFYFGHGEYLYDGTLHVPFMVRAPGLIPTGTRLSGLTRLEDVMPTLLDLLGVPAPGGLDGQTLAPQLRAGGAQSIEGLSAVHLSDHILVRESNPRQYIRGREGRWWAYRDGDYKLIRIPRGAELSPEEEFYDYVEDPDEQNDLLEERPDPASRLRDALGVRARELLLNAPSGDGDGTNEHLDSLRSLGYAN